jgi:hypothetical protein
MEAIGSKDDRISLCHGSASLYSVSKQGGEFPQRAFCDAIANLGTVDVLKLDCEGADIFTDVAAWRHVRTLVMEYHLWARHGFHSACNYGRVTRQPLPSCGSSLCGHRDHPWFPVPRLAGVVQDTRVVNVSAPARAGKPISIEQF